MLQRKELYTKRGWLNTIILVVLFLMILSSFYIQFGQILAGHGLDILQMIIKLLFLISLIGFWYLKRWAILSSAFVVFVGGIVTIPEFKQYAATIVLWGLFVWTMYKDQLDPSAAKQV